MVELKTIYVEGLSNEERTKVLQDGLEQYGYKIETTEFFRILTSVGLGHLVSGLMQRKEAIVGDLTTPTMTAYGVRKLNGHCAFFISVMRTGLSDTLENRCVVETEEEYNQWLTAFMSGVTSKGLIPSMGEKIEPGTGCEKKQVMPRNDGIIETCCDCRHFRMWKPEPEYCTLMKTTVKPLATGCPDFVRRKNLPGDKMTKEYHQLIKTLRLPETREFRESYAEGGQGTMLGMDLRCDICGKDMVELEHELRIFGCNHGTWARLLYVSLPSAYRIKHFESHPRGFGMNKDFEQKLGWR